MGGGWRKVIGNWLLTSPPPILELKYFLMGPVLGMFQ